MKTLLAEAINFQELINQAFPNYDPAAGKINLTDPNLTLGKIISAFLPYVLILMGLLLFIYLLWGGFDFLFAEGDPEKIKGARMRIVNALVGFLIIFSAYWLARLVEYIFGLKIF